MTASTVVTDIQKASTQFSDFEGVMRKRADDLQKKRDLWATIKDPQVAIIVFVSSVLCSGGVFDNTIQSKTGVKADGASLMGRQEDMLTETGNGLRYASAYRAAISDIQTELNKTTGTGGDVTTIRNDIAAMRANFSAGVFQGADATFESSLVDIESVLNKVGPGKQYANLAAMWTQAKTVGDQTAGADIQKVTNATNNLFSMVGVQSNVLNTQLSYVEGELKSYAGVAHALLDSVMKINAQAIKNVG